MSSLWESIDLATHGMIEAHAGTGKTYTIVRLLLRMLETTITDGKDSERFIDISELLLVTYTEKAAGELKRRVREGLEKRIDELQTDPQRIDLAAHLEGCLNNLHEACIGTIHAVCLRLLRTWPFESGVHFETEFTDDAEGLRSCLRQSMRTDWQDTTTGIPWALSTLARRGMRVDNSYYSRIEETAVAIPDEEFTVLDRSMLRGGNLRTIRSEHDRSRSTLNTLRPALNDLLEKCIGALEQVDRCCALPADRQQLLRTRLSDLTHMQQGGMLDHTILRNPCKVQRKGIYTAALLKKTPLLAPVDRLAKELAAHPVTEAMQKIDELETVLLPLAFIYDAAERTARRWKRTKLERGLVSYRDMLKLMQQAVTERPRFAAFLRERFHYAIIDEFQDTSRLQWEVFRHLSLNAPLGNGPRLYLVGDPKQSIYSIQGADVHSYLDAREAVEKSGGTVYSLTENFRSLKPVIGGYNRLFAARPGETDWFLFTPSTGTKGGIFYPESDAVNYHVRTLPPASPPPLAPVQVLPLAGTALHRMRQMAEYAREIISALRHTKLSLPDGDGWTERSLDYADFAVIVETRRLGDPFLEEFRRHGIPAVKYKMEGVFQSPIARALHALLRAILHPSGDPAPRLAALLTHFFNHSPEAIDPERDLEPCAHPHCTGANLCITHALSEWTVLAGRSLWAQLFDRVIERTAIEQRLLMTADGERHLADLRQVVDYCLERLYCDNLPLPHLLEHLGSLLDGNASPGRDRNLHTLETQKSSVKILTMHAAKGLEFPVVFVAAGHTRTKPSTPLRWTGEKGERRIMPTISNASKTQKTYPSLAEANHAAIEQVQRERRRVLYVACTRAQALLFLPMHLERLPEPQVTAPRWTDYPPAGAQPDCDLTPRLQQLLDDDQPGNPVTVFDQKHLPTPVPIENRPSKTDTEPFAATALPDLDSLDLPSRIVRQTSYSQLTKLVSVTREADRSEEPGSPPHLDSLSATPPVPSPLPGGRHTGDALHRSLEDLLTMDNACTGYPDDAVLRSIVEKHLATNGIISRIAASSSGGAEDAVDKAVTAACNCVKGALTAHMELPDGYLLDSVAALAPGNRFPEMEFMLQLGRHWGHGFMDLVFRVPSRGSACHPWRYHVLDWKSDTLPDFTLQTINNCIIERHYNLQAHLYCHALDTFLRSILGTTYDPAQHLGGAVYLFLREHEHAPLTASSVWTCRAQPEHDRRYILDKVHA